MSGNILSKCQLTSKETVCVVNDFLAYLKLGRFAHVLETTVVCLFRLEQDSLAYGRFGGATIGVVLTKLLMSTLQNGGLLLLLTDHRCTSAEATCLIVVTAHVVCCRRALLAITALVVHLLTSLRASLSIAHPVCATHGPGVSMLVLVTKGADASIDQCLGTVW